jgi:hypothetical protein
MPATRTDSPGAARGWLGSGLPAWLLATLFGLSVVLFLFWGGALWRAPAEASHLVRIVGSYLVVVPLVIGALAGLRRLSLGALVTSVGLIWAAKLLVTSSLYALLAPGTSHDYAARRTWTREGAEAPAGDGYRAAGAVERAGVGAVDGVLRGAAADLDGALVWVPEPGPGRPLGEPRQHDWSVGADHAQRLRLVFAGDTIAVTNPDAELHTLVLAGEGRASQNLPLVPGGRLQLAAPEPGRYRLSCQRHAAPLGDLLVVDHPYAAAVGADGRFELDDLPAGRHTIRVLTAGGHLHEATVDVAAGARHPLDLDLRRGP